MLTGVSGLLLAVLWGIIGFLTGQLDPAEAQKVIWGGLVAVTMRLGIANIKS